MYHLIIMKREQGPPTLNKKPTSVKSGRKEEYQVSISKASTCNDMSGTSTRYSHGKKKTHSPSVLGFPVSGK